MTSGHYISIQSFPNVFTVWQTALVKLIVTVNCKVFSFSFGLRQLRQPALPRLRIFSFARTIFNCCLCDANSIMFTCDIRKKWKEYIDICQLYNKILRTFRTALVVCRCEMSQNNTKCLSSAVKERKTDYYYVCNCYKLVIDRSKSYHEKKDLRFSMTEPSKCALRFDSLSEASCTLYAVW